MRTEYADADLTFYLQVYRDLTRAEWCLTQLRQHYPDARVIVVSDGDPDLKFAALVARFGVELHYGERLYPLPNGGRMLERIFALWGMRTDYLFSIDPDTQICRRFRWLPDEPVALFGDCWPIQGGCMGFTRQAGQRLFDSRILCDPLLTRPAESWAKLPDGRLVTDMLTAIDEDGLVRTDWIIFWACHQLGIPQISFGEVYSRWREIVPEGLDRAVTHPHKELPIERDEL
jgi:hypothetical protein